MAEDLAPICPYCNTTSELVYGTLLYPHNPALAHLPFYYCGPACDAWVGCHKDTEIPLGRLANAELRHWKVQAHVAFDKLWRVSTISKRKELRRRAYLLLAEQMGLPPSECHIGKMDVTLCKLVIEIVDSRVIHHQLRKAHKANANANT